MLCDNCRSSNPAGAKICLVCGAALPEQSLSIRQGAAEPRGSDPAYDYEDGFVADARDFDNSAKEPHENSESLREYAPAPSSSVYNAYQPPAQPQPSFNNYQTPAQAQPSFNNYQPPAQAQPVYYNYQSPAPQQPVIQYYSAGSAPYNGKPQKRSAGAIVFYVFSGLLALCTLGLNFLPSIDRLGGLLSGVSYPNRYFSVIEHALSLIGKTDLFSSYVSDRQSQGIFILCVFCVPMLFQLLWALFSFLRLKSAGGMGLTGSIIYVNVAIYWLVYLLSGSNYANFVTPVPFIMIIAGVLGIAFSSIQLSQRNRVR